MFEIKKLEIQDIFLMEEILKDDNMDFNAEHLENFINDDHNY